MHSWCQFDILALYVKPTFGGDFELWGRGGLMKG